MRPLVLDCYRRLLHAGKDYPRGLGYVRERAKAAFFENAALANDDDIARAIARGRWWAKEIVGVVQLRKYRAMRARYGDATAGDNEGALEARWREEARP